MVLPWHWEQSPLAGWAASLAWNVALPAAGRTLKPRYCALAPLPVTVSGYWPMPIQAAPEATSWQVLQPLLVPPWIMDDVGAGSLKPLLGTLRGVVTDIGLEGVLPAWQFSQVVLVGKCDVAAAVLEGGITTMLLTP